MRTAKNDRELSQEEMVQLLRNTLIVAGAEMSDQADCWPVIKSTIRSIMRDWEDLKIERAVHEEMRKHLYEQLHAMENILPTCAEDIRAVAGERLKELREIYDAYFEDVKEGGKVLGYITVPIYVKRAEAILDTLSSKK